MGAKSVVTIGNFDGCHLGHQALFSKALVLKDQLAASKSVALTFDPHPAQIIAPKETFVRLQPLEERISTIKFYGIDDVHVINFTKELAGTTAEDFLTMMTTGLTKACGIVVGSQFRFGHKRLGDGSFLTSFCKQRGIAVELVDEVTLDGGFVSSTRIRQELHEHGNIDGAKKLLGRFWTFTGAVEHGDKLGRKLGFATANLNVDGIVSLKRGVYAVGARIFGKTSDYRLAVMNVGVRPTVSNDGLQRIEVHILPKDPSKMIDEKSGSTAQDSSHDFYGKKLQIMPITRIRDEIQFNSKEALVEQIKHDVSICYGLRLPETFERL